MKGAEATAAAAAAADGAAGGGRTPGGSETDRAQLAARAASQLSAGQEPAAGAGAAAGTGVPASSAGGGLRPFAFDIVQITPPKGIVPVSITRIVGPRDAAPMVSRRQWQSAGLFPTHKIGLTRALQALASEARVWRRTP